MTTNAISLLNKESIRAREKARVETNQLKLPHSPEPKLKLLNALSVLMFLSAASLLLYVLYLIAWPQHPLVVKSVSVTTPIVHSPGTLTYQINACKNTSLTPDVHRKIVQDNVGAPLTTTPGLATAGCRHTKVTIPIPSGIPPGNHYILYSDITYHVNAIRDVHVFWHSQPFEVTND